jgi:hypothetical protein
MVPGERDAAGSGRGDDLGEGAEMGGERADAHPLWGVERVGKTVQVRSFQGTGNGRVGIVRQAESGEEAEPEGSGPGRFGDLVPAADVGTDAQAHGTHSGR